MDINASYNFCQVMARQEGHEGHFTPSQFNWWALFALTAAIAQRLPFVDTNPEVHELLLPLLEINEAVEIIDGKLAIPADKLEVHSVYSSEHRKIEMLRPDQFQDRRHNALTGPEVKYPIGTQRPGFIEVLPVEIGPAMLYYYRKPREPKWGFTADADRNYTFDPATSQDFEVSEKLHEEICIRILQYAGISLSNDVLVQYGLTRERK